MLAAQLLLPLDAVALNHVELHDHHLIVHAHSTQQVAACLACQTPSMRGCVATIAQRTPWDRSCHRAFQFLRSDLEQLLDALDLASAIAFADIPNLPLPQHVHDVVASNGARRRLK